MPCPLCDDTGWKPVDENGVRRVVRCECWREQVGQTRLVDSNIPKRYQHCTLANFRAYNESLQHALDAAKLLTERFPTASTREQLGRGLFLDGAPGVGKTHLAVAVLKGDRPRSRRRGRSSTTRAICCAVIRSTYDPSIPHHRARGAAARDDGRSARPGRSRRGENLGVGRGDDEPDREHALQRAARDDFHVELSRHPRRHRFELAAVPHRPPDCARGCTEMCDFLEMDGADYRELRPTAAWTTSSRCGRCGKKGGLPSPRGGRQARAQLREPAGRDGPRRSEMARRTGGKLEVSRSKAQV